LSACVAANRNGSKNSHWVFASAANDGADRRWRNQNFSPSKLAKGLPRFGTEENFDALQVQANSLTAIGSRFPSSVKGFQVLQVNSSEHFYINPRSFRNFRLITKEYCGLHAILPRFRSRFAA
jgi:hypothetical protein